MNLSITPVRINQTRYNGISSKNNLQNSQQKTQNSNLSFKSDPYPTIWEHSIPGKDIKSIEEREKEIERILAEKQKQKEEREAFEALETTAPAEWARKWNPKVRKDYYNELYKEELSHYWIEGLHKKRLKAKYDAMYADEKERVLFVLLQTSQGVAVNKNNG